MSTNITLSVTAEGDDVGMAVAIMARTVSELMRGTENLQSINLAVFTDEYIAEDEDQPAAEVGRQIPIHEQNPDGLEFVHSVDLDARP